MTRKDEGGKEEMKKRGEKRKVERKGKKDGRQAEGKDGGFEQVQTGRKDSTKE